MAFQAFPRQPAICGRRAAKPASSAEKEKTGRRAQEWGFKGAKPFCESLSTFFSEESRGPSRPERQRKRILRGNSQTGKGKRQMKNAHTKPHGGQTDTACKSRRNSGQPRKNGQPGTWRGAPDAEKNLRTGKIRVRSFACPEGLVNRGRQKFASLFLTGTAFFCFALRTMRRKAQNKRGRRPLSSPASFLKKA